MKTYSDFNDISSQNEQRKNQILKGFSDNSPLDNDIEKSFSNDLEKGVGGEGSKGGKVIGHTKSGKPIYEHQSQVLKTESWGDKVYGAHHPEHAKFTANDHKDAMNHHLEKQSHYNGIINNTKDLDKHREDADVKEAFAKRNMHSNEANHHFQTYKEMRDAKAQKEPKQKEPKGDFGDIHKKLKGSNDLDDELREDLGHSVVDHARKHLGVGEKETLHSQNSEGENEKFDDHHERLLKESKQKGKTIHDKESGASASMMEHKSGQKWVHVETSHGGPGVVLYHHKKK